MKQGNVGEIIADSEIPKNLQLQNKAGRDDVETNLKRHSFCGIFGIRPRYRHAPALDI